MIVPEILRLQTNKPKTVITLQSGERRTSSSFCFTRTFCFASIPMRTRFAALLRSAFRTSDSPFPIFVFSASSNTRPSSAFRRWEPVRFSSSGFATPDRSCVWINLCSSVSFCRFDLEPHQRYRKEKSRVDAQVQVVAPAGFCFLCWIRNFLSQFGNFRRLRAEVFKSNSKCGHRKNHAP